MTQESKAPSPSQSPPAGPVARATARVVAVIAVCLSLYQLYTAGVAALTALVQRSIHLAAILALTFLLKPAFARVSKDRLNLWVIIDWLLAAAAFPDDVLQLEVPVQQAGMCELAGLDVEEPGAD